MIRGSFPQDLRDRGPYDVIALLAVFEHVPDEERAAFVAACRDLLRAGGRVVMTVPAPLVDRIIDALRRFRLVHGMDIEAHHGYQPEETPGYFAAGMGSSRTSVFELGLNHLSCSSCPPRLIAVLARLEIVGDPGGAALEGDGGQVNSPPNCTLVGSGERDRAESTTRGGRRDANLPRCA